jgi:hypothetical protein
MTIAKEFKGWYVSEVVMNKGIKPRLLVKAFIACCCLSILGGCAQDDEPMPEIVYDYSQRETVRPRPVRPEIRSSIDRNIPRDWLPPSRLERKWTAIVLHHSATESGSAAVFDRWHKEGNYWEGVGYDFVIGNGTDSGDGQVEVTFRWREQRTGAHCKTPNNWANEKAIGICLVGNFDHGRQTARQMRSLVKLVRFLQNRYRIPRSRVYGHNTTPGARVTNCPGKNFSVARLKAMLGY